MGYFSETDIERNFYFKKNKKKEDTIYSLAQKIIVQDPTEDLEELLCLSLDELKLKKQRLDLREKRAILERERQFRKSIGRRSYASSDDYHDMNGHRR